tara:strand:- start:2503 stop:3213 length:711 start_codon:yes stop_codon:yes gene_type:complete
MKLGIMQPYFFPYLGYFSLIQNCDEFILFDTPQFIRHGWIERNKILKPNGEPLYIKVPLLKHSRETAINDLKIRNTENWKEKILAQLIPYKKKAKNYFNVINLINEIFEFETDSIVSLNNIALQKTCSYLEISTPIKIWSKMNIEIGKVNAPDEWALHICKAMNATSYYNPEGGIDFFDKNKYLQANIDLKFLKMDIIPYEQFENEFIPFLSILDILMFNDKKEINMMLDSFKFID